MEQILTFKIKHNSDFSTELKQAKQIALFAIQNRDKLSTSYVSHIGLKSIIANQILRHYGRNKKCKSINNVNLIIPNQGINVDKDNKSIYIPSLKLNINYYFDNNFIKINQIIINKKYCFVSVLFQCPDIIETTDYIGVDLNVNSHCAVVGIPTTGKIKKLGKKAKHIYSKYKNIRKQLQKKNKKKKLKQIKHREKNIIKDLNHKISKEIVKTAKDNNCGIKLENLTGIRKAKNRSKDFRYSLNSWNFYQLRQMIEYKSRLQGIEIILINPSYTSQKCSRCGEVGNRQGKKFKCPCGHVDHADANAAFNIGQSVIDSDITEGSPDTPKGTILIN